MHATLSVLEALVTRAPLSLTDLAATLEAPKSSVYRVCTVLVERGWLVRNPDGRYDLGIRAFGLSPRSSDFPMVRAFCGIAADLLTRHNETVALAALDADESVYIALEETSHPVRLVTHVGNRTPAFASASGRVILADRAPQVVAAEYAGRSLVTPTGRRLRGVDEFLAILEKVRREGYAENHEETAVGLYAVSVPVRNAATAVLAALTMCVPTSRVDHARRERLIGDLRDAGQLLSSAVPWLAAWNSVRAEARQLVPAG
jgi:DNA-binding IclR family transcriptional regulator